MLADTAEKEHRWTLLAKSNALRKKANKQQNSIKTYETDFIHVTQFSIASICVVYVINTVNISLFLSLFE
jgi:hypothetical protein